jgi:ParB family chromosome partitioning protein
MSTAKILKKKQAGKTSKPKKHAAVKQLSNPLIKNGEFKQIPLSDLDASPLNYRQIFSKTELEELAADIARHGMISNLTVRCVASGRYELVVGERRFRAAAMAGLKEVPANIVSLSDPEVIEIQLSENGQRISPHPMREAVGMAQLQKTYPAIEEIAVRLGKSKAYIYSRLKLLSLIEPIREIFLADKCLVWHAMDIAVLSPESQTEFYEKYCASWKEDEDFEMPDTADVLDQFKYDLADAPFNIKDKNLLPDAGACITCPFNSAVLKTLFPDMAKESVCTKKECYRSKCLADASIRAKQIFAEHEPQALIYYHSPENLKSLIGLIPEAAALPTHNYRNVQVMEKPEPPDREDYINEQEENEDDQENQMDEESFAEVVREYNDDLQEYNDLLSSGKLMTGLLVSENRMQVVSFNPEEKRNDQPAHELTKAADLQAAIKTGTVSAQLLQGEINRINARETRLVELDREKLQLQVHEKFAANLNALLPELTPADQVATRLILFQSLNYSARNIVMETLFPADEGLVHGNNEELYRQFENLNDSQFAYLIRMAVISNAHSKNPRSETGYFLYKMGEQAGLDIAIIEKEQKEKTTNRQTKHQERISSLQKQIEKLESKK